MAEGLRSLRGGKLLLAVFLGALALLLAGRWVVVLYVDWLWFSSEGFASVFWTRAMWEWGVRIAVGALAAVAAWSNLREVAKSLRGIQLRRRFGDLVIQEQLPASYVRWGLLFGSTLLGLWFATAVPPGTGLRALLLARGGPWGETDPILGRDLAFYLFDLPMAQAAVTYSLILVVLLGALAVAGYAATGALGLARGRLFLAAPATRHLGVLVGVFLVVLSFRFWLAPYGVLFDGTSGIQGIFGYADHQAGISGHRMTAFLCLAAGGVSIWGGWGGRLVPAGVSTLVLVAAAVGLTQVYPALVQRFEVQPNELERERPYIENAVAFTRLGFGLQDLDRRRLDYVPPDSSHWLEAIERIDRLPVWTEETLLTTFRQLEARFQYYDFHQVAMGRYPSSSGSEPVAVAVRELDPAGIPDPNWQNLHLREHYISGMGAVAGQLNRRTAEGRLPMFLTAIPPEFRAGPGVPDGLDLTRPSVFVGTQPQLHAIVNPTTEDFLAPDGSPGVPGVDFPAGIPLGSLIRKVALAWRFQDLNLLLASEVGRESRVVFRRQAQERVVALAPFLSFPEPPYPVVAGGRLVWILEGFTVGGAFPLSLPHDIPAHRGVNYLRNSVKATVDAVTGETRFYAVDPDDPVLRAYRAGFPGLVLDAGEMPEEIEAQLRYSRYLLNAQALVLTRFQQADPPVFHGQQDRWAFATELATNPNVPIPYPAEYSLLTLPGESEETYALSTVFVPQGRRNLAAFLVGRWEDGKGRLNLWDAPVEEQILGPGQIEAMVEQDPIISQQFSLWRQGGSQVWTGRLHLVPVGRTLYYMEAVFLAADVDAIPEIQRFVVSDGQRVVMEPTLERAVRRLSDGSAIGASPPGEVTGGVPAPTAPSWSGQALEALERAESRLREGDWEGFGAGLEEVRRILRDGGGAGP